MDSLREIQNECWEDSVRWFTSLAGNLPHHVLALCGETGELANEVKKLQRLNKEELEHTDINRLANEVVDCFIYVVNIANLLDLNLGAAYKEKRDYNNERFTSD